MNSDPLNFPHPPPFDDDSESSQPCKKQKLQPENECEEVCEIDKLQKMLRYEVFIADNMNLNLTSNRCLNDIHTLMMAYKNFFIDWTYCVICQDSDFYRFFMENFVINTWDKTFDRDWYDRMIEGDTISNYKDDCYYLLEHSSYCVTIEELTKQIPVQLRTNNIISILEAKFEYMQVFSKIMNKQKDIDFCCNDKEKEELNNELNELVDSILFPIEPYEPSNDGFFSNLFNAMSTFGSNVMGEIEEEEDRVRKALEYLLFQIVGGEQFEAGQNVWNVYKDINRMSMYHYKDVMVCDEDSECFEHDFDYPFVDELGYSCYLRSTPFYKFYMGNDFIPDSLVCDQVDYFEVATSLPLDGVGLVNHFLDYYRDLFRDY